MKFGLVFVQRFAESSSCLAVETLNEYKWFATVLCWAFDGHRHRDPLQTSAALYEATNLLVWIYRVMPHFAILLHLCRIFY